MIIGGMKGYTCAPPPRPPQPVLSVRYDFYWLPLFPVRRSLNSHNKGACTVREISYFSALRLIAKAVFLPIFTPPRTNSSSMCFNPNSAKRLIAFRLLTGLVEAGMPAVPILKIPIRSLRCPGPELRFSSWALPIRALLPPPLPRRPLNPGPGPKHHLLQASCR